MLRGGQGNVRPYPELTRPRTVPRLPISLNEFGLVGDQFAPQLIGQAARLKPRQGVGCRREDRSLPPPGRGEVGFATIVDLRRMVRKFSDDLSGQCLIDSRPAVAHGRRTVHRLSFRKHESIERQVSIAIPDELKIDWSSHAIVLPCMLRINAAISIVAKFEKVSDTAYGKMTRSWCRIPPQV